MSETSEITWPLIHALNAIPGVVAYRVHAGKLRVKGGWMRLGDEGIPDIGVVVRGKALFIETKKSGGTLSMVQAKYHSTLKEAGAAVWVCRSVADALAKLKEEFGIRFGA